MRQRLGCLAVYVVFLLALSAWSGWEAYEASFDCADDSGHGPGAGSRECEASLARKHEVRPNLVREAVVKPLAIGGGLLVLWLVLVPLGRLPFFRND